METDLLDVPNETVARLARSAVDVVSVHLPAVTAQTYTAVMGTDAYVPAIENVRLFVTERLAARGRVPILAPTFVKCRQNLAEMETWYDQWLSAVGSAVIRGPSAFGGLVTDVAVADMAPSRRRPCARIASRLTVLSDGRIVSCEEDVIGQQVLGDATTGTIADAWQGAAAALRTDHATMKLDDRPLCAGCTEWHRP